MRKPSFLSAIGSHGRFYRREWGGHSPEGRRGQTDLKPGNPAVVRRSCKATVLFTCISFKILIINYYFSSCHVDKVLDAES